MIQIRHERFADFDAREALLDACFGEHRHARTCQRLRDGRVPAAGLAFSAVHRRRLVGTVRLWHVSAAGIPALVLGPLAGLALLPAIVLAVGLAVVTAYLVDRSAVPIPLAALRQRRGAAPGR